MVVLVMLVPILYSLRTSLTNLDLLSGAKAEFIGVVNYARIFTDPALLQSVLNTAVYTIASIVLEVMLGLGLALLLNRELHDGGVFRTLLTMPLFVAPVVVGMQWRFLLINEYGILNYLLGLAGIRGPLWLGSPIPAMASVVVADSWLVTPFAMLVILAGLQSISPELLEAAAMDGAGRWKRFALITWPLLRPAIAVVLLIRTIDAIRVFDLVWILTGGGPASATEMLSTLTYRIGFQYLNIGQASALAVTIVIILCLLSTGLIRVTGAMRGGD